MDIDFKRMIELMDDYNLAHLRVSNFVSTDKMKTWNKFIDWNGDFFEVPENLKGTVGWCGHPALNKSEFIKSCLPFIDKEVNPEKQIKGNHPIIRQFFNYYSFGVFHPLHSGKAVNDTGRRWMIENGFCKKGNKAWFVEWTKNE